MLEAVTTTVNDREAAETATEFRVCAFSHPLLTPTGPDRPTTFRLTARVSAEHEAKRDTAIAQHPQGVHDVCSVVCSVVLQCAG
jgi:hypothetical protein